MSDSAKKSDHKHDYHIIKIKNPDWFTHKRVCKKCGKINNRYAMH